VKQKILFFVFVFFALTFLSAFLIAAPPAANDEEVEFTNLSKDLEMARQEALDQDLDELEKMLELKERTRRRDLEELERQKAAAVQDEPYEKKPEPAPETAKEEPPPAPPVAIEVGETAPEDEHDADDTIFETPPTHLEKSRAPEKAEFENGKIKFKTGTIKESPQHFGFSLSGGVYKPRKMVGRGDDYSSIYRGDNWFLGDNGLWVDGSLEWQFFKSFGRMAIKGTSGLWYIQGRHDATTDASSDKIEYELYVVPAFIGVVYRLQFFSKQWVIPFFEASYGGFRFDQRKGVKNDQYGTFKNAYILGWGFQINGNAIEPSAARDFDIEWGVNQTSFVAQARVITMDIPDNFNFGTDSRNFLFTGGLLFEF